MLLLRISNYKTYDFIIEHQRYNQYLRLYLDDKDWENHPFEKFR